MVPHPPSSAYPVSPAVGYFGPGSAIWEVDREIFLLLGSMRALLLQIAHPAVAEGVSRYSNFEQDAIGRAQRTFTALAMIIFGDTRQADLSARRLIGAHRSIKGTYKTGSKTCPYRADDPALMLWVLATIVDTNMLIYEFVNGPQSPELKERFYCDWKTVGELMGIPQDTFPADWGEFQAYMRDMLSGSTLCIGEPGWKVCQAILYHRHVPTFLMRWLALAFLPPRQATDFGLGSHGSTRRNTRYFLAVARFVFRLLPKSLRCIPAYYQARGRIARFERRSLSFFDRFYSWLGRRVNLPLGLPAIK